MRVRNRLWASRWRGMILVALTFFYFLIFAQFGFLHRIEMMLGAEHLDAVLMVMGVSGVCGALLAAFRFEPHWGARWLSAGFGGSAGGAVLAAWSSRQGQFILSALLTGVFLGILTTALVGVLSTRFPSKQAGLLCGMGTGLSYFLSNVPWIYEAGPRAQCLIAAIACLLGLCVRLPEKYVQDDTQSPVVRASLWEVVSLAGVVLIFLVLIWSDSAAFTYIQQSDDLKASSWSGASNLLLIGVVHFAAAVVGGMIMDRGKERWLYAFAFLGLLFGITLLQNYSVGLVGALLYAAGVSFYSAGLVAFALVRKSFQPAVFRAGIVFAVSGWIGSALGIGMVNDLGRIPGLFWPVSATVLALGITMWGRGRGT